MQAWGAWFGTLGDSVADVGNPFGNSATVTSGGVADGGKSGAGGYSIVSADSLGDAAAKAKGCPVLASGGSVEIYEAIPDVAPLARAAGSARAARRGVSPGGPPV